MGRLLFVAPYEHVAALWVSRRFRIIPLGSLVGIHEKVGRVRWPAQNLKTALPGRISFLEKASAWVRCHLCLSMLTHGVGKLHVSGHHGKRHHCTSLFCFNALSFPRLSMAYVRGQGDCIHIRIKYSSPSCWAAHPLNRSEPMLRNSGSSCTWNLFGILPYQKCYLIPSKQSTRS